MFKKLSFLCCILLFAASTKVSFSGNDDEAYIIGIRYPKSYDAKTYQNRADNIRNVLYKVRLSFPSKEVLQFYDDKLKDIGWVTFVEPAYREGDRKWRNFIDGTVEGHPLVHQLLATWANKDKSRMIVFALRYYSTKMTVKEKYHAKEPDNDIQEVILQIMPFMILSDIEGGK
jgi:hypothetical protein